MSKKTEEASVSVVSIHTETITVRILGKTPLVTSAMSAKVIQGLLLPPKKKNAAERASTLKHEPLEEFRASMYLTRDDAAPTRIIFPACAFKRALADTAKDLPGSAKAQIGRLTWVNGNDVAIYGVPQLIMPVVRDSGITRAPNVRSKAILPQWACSIAISFVTPLLNMTTVSNLLAAAGLMRGVGDGRPEKGYFTFGQFELVGAEDTRWTDVVAAGGMAAQDAAIRDPQPYDVETARLLDWFNTEVQRRGFKLA